MYKRKKALDTSVASRAFFDSKDNKAGYKASSLGRCLGAAFLLILGPGGVFILCRHVH